MGGIYLSSAPCLFVSNSPSTVHRADHPFHPQCRSTPTKERTPCGNYPDFRDWTWNGPNSLSPEFRPETILQGRIRLQVGSVDLWEVGLIKSTRYDFLEPNCGSQVKCHCLVPVFHSKRASIIFARFPTPVSIGSEVDSGIPASAAKAATSVIAFSICVAKSEKSVSISCLRNPAFWPV